MRYNTIKLFSISFIVFCLNFYIRECGGPLILSTHGSHNFKLALSTLAIYFL
jgi:hypothetical protein